MSKTCRYCGETFGTTQGVAQHASRVHGTQWIPEAELRERYVEQRQTTTQLAEHYDTTTKTILKTLERYGIERRTNADAMMRGLRGKPASFRTKESGYEYWRTHDGDDTYRVYVHRLLAVAVYGFDALHDREVHHKQPIPWLNTPDNIELLEKSEHGRMHANERWER